MGCILPFGIDYSAQIENWYESEKRLRQGDRKYDVANLRDDISSVTIRSSKLFRIKTKAIAEQNIL